MRRSHGRTGPRHTRHETRSYRTRLDTPYYPRESEDGAVDEYNQREDTYEAELLRRYKWLVRDRVGQEQGPLPDIKNIRVSPPEKYNGEDDIEKFDTWLAGLLRWFRVYNVTGDHKDTMRVDLCGTTLAGLAATWYADEVEAWNRRTSKWYFEDLVCEIYKRFIHEVTAQNAATSYQKTKYSCAKGALAFFNDLQRHANRMVQPPDEYSMKRKFLRGLPEDIVENLLKSRRVSAEHTLMDNLLREVKAMESSIQAYHNYRNERHDRPSTSSTTKPSGTQPTNNTRVPRVLRFVKKNQGNYRWGNSKEGRDTQNQGTSRPYPRPSGGNNNNKNSQNRRYTRPATSRNDNENKGAPPGSTQKKTGQNHGGDVTCYKCGKPGHISPNCPTNGPRVFAAQIIDEDAEDAPTESANVQEGHEENEDRDESRSHESDHENDHDGDPVGSQYESDPEGYALDQYEDYVEVDDYSDEGSDVVYIRATRATDRSEIDEILSGDIDVTSISDTSTLVDSGDMSMDLEVIPNGMTPYELLSTLTEETRLMIYCERKESRDPKWTPHYVGTTADRYRPKVSHRLLSLGYDLDDEVEDSEYLHQLAHDEREHFAELTGYRVPDYVVCDACGICIPHVSEMIFTDREGCAYTRTIIRCRTDTTRVFIRAMNDIEETPRAYRYRMVRPVGTMDRPIRGIGETLCLTAYVTINGTKAYALFDSGSTTDAVTPDFTRVANLTVKELAKPVTLQLGCSGSRSKVNFATVSSIEFTSIDVNTYLDIANLDKYDTILGTPFMRKHGISLDFETQEIVIRGTLRIPALLEGEGEAAAKPKVIKTPFRRK